MSANVEKSPVGQTFRRHEPFATSEQVERERVDSRFAARREVGTDNPVLQATGALRAQLGKTGLDGATNPLNNH